jgi:urea transport system substrate-binding protein
MMLDGDKHSGKHRGATLLTWLMLVVLTIGGIWFFQRSAPRALPPIRVGVLHSLTGTMAVSEKTVTEATLFAIEEINRSGGLLGRQIEPVIVDGKSDWPTFAAGADRLISQEKVDVIFGCWTSACRKTIKPLFEGRDALLVYPVQYEGLEESPNILYTGPAPNQQIQPAVAWALGTLGKKVWLVGSDYVFPRAANRIITLQVQALGGQVLGDDYVKLGGQDFSAIARRIAANRPDIIFNTLNGDSNIAFFRALKDAGVTPDQIPTLSFSIAEPEISSIGLDLMVGNYAAQTYFQTVDTPENHAFVRGFQARYGTDHPVSDMMEAAYTGVRLWAQAVTQAESSEWERVRRFLLKQEMLAPGGPVKVDTETRHLYRTARIGRITAAGTFTIVWQSDGPLKPVPYPPYLSKVDWDNFLSRLFRQWNGQWAAP